MNKSGIGLLAIAGVVVMGIWAASSSHTDANQLVNNSSPEAFMGDWVVTEHGINGIVDTEFAAADLAIDTSVNATIVDGSGSTQSLQFVSSQPDQSGAYKLLVNTSDDSEGMGGAGGSRKAIARINASGNMEIVEATSADDNYPADFSQATKDVSITWVLTPEL